MRAALLILLASVLPASLSAQSILHEETSATPEVAAAIEDLVLEWADKFNRGDWVEIHDSWDPDEEAPYYLGEERDRWIMGKEGLHSYFNPPGFVRSLMESVNIVPYRLRVRQVSDSIVIATWDNRLDLKVRTPPGDKRRLPGERGLPQEAPGLDVHSLRRTGLVCADLHGTPLPQVGLARLSGKRHAVRPKLAPGARRSHGE